MGSPIEPEAAVLSLRHGTRDAGRSAEPGGNEGTGGAAWDAPETVDHPPTKRAPAIAQKRVAEAGRELAVVVGACGGAGDEALCRGCRGRARGRSDGARQSQAAGGLMTRCVMGANAQCSFLAGNRIGSCIRTATTSPPLRPGSNLHDLTVARTTSSKASSVDCWT